MKIRLFGGENIEKSFQAFWSRIEANNESRLEEEGGEEEYGEEEDEDEEFQDDEQRLLPSNWSDDNTIKTGENFIKKY